VAVIFERKEIISILDIMQTLLVTTENETQTDLLVRLAKELHLKIEIVEDETAEKKALLQLAEHSFAEEWNSEEDNHWDEFLKNATDVSKR